MIKFFRKIRQTLLEKNRVSKYLIYAFGEIILVVIGILIALQINNWNEKRKNKIIENEYYCQLLADLNLDFNRLEILESKSKEVQELGNQFLLDLYNHTKSKDYLLNSYIQVIRYDDFISTQIAFQDLLSSGNINLLKNKALKNQIILYYQEVEILSNKIALNNKLMSDEISNLSVIDFGWHEMENFNLNSDVRELLPINNWHLNKDSEYFKKIQNIIVLAIGANFRKQEILDSIKHKTLIPLNNLKELCNN